MRSKAPKVADTHWGSMGEVSNWFKRNKIDINMHVYEKDFNCAPSTIWWIHLMVVAKFSRISTPTFKSLQGHHVTDMIQQTHLMSVQIYLLHVMGGDSHLSPL